MNIFGGHENFVDIFWGPSQNWTSLRGISMYFRVFSEGKYTESRYFGIAKNSKKMGCLIFLIFLRDKQ